MLAEILAQSNFGVTQLIKEYTMEVTSTVWDKISFSMDIPPRTKQITINFALLVFAYIACRRVGINFMLVIAFGVLYFLYEYLDYECHKVSMHLNSMEEDKEDKFNDTIKMICRESQLKIQFHLYSAEKEIRVKNRRIEAGLAFSGAKTIKPNAAII